MLAFNFSNSFILSICKGTNPFIGNFPELVEARNYVDMNEIEDTELLSTCVSLILTNLTNDDLDEIELLHKYVSIASGINIGLATEKYQHRSFLYNLRKLLFSIYEGKYASQPVNQIRNNLFQYLHSKDDTMILLVTILIDKVLRHKRINCNLKMMEGLAKASEQQEKRLNLDDIFSSTSDKTEDNPRNVMELDVFGLTEKEINGFFQDRIKCGYRIDILDQLTNVLN